MPAFSTLLLAVAESNRWYEPSLPHLATHFLHNQPPKTMRNEDYRSGSLFAKLNTCKTPITWIKHKPDNPAALPGKDRNSTL